VPRAKAARSSKHRRAPFILISIAVLKLVKAALLIAVGIGAIKLLHKDLAATVLHWTQALGVDPDNRFIHGTLVKILRVTPRQLRELSVGTFFYAALFVTEGVGLLMEKLWAEYFTIITTALLIPLEIYELTSRLTFTRAAVLIVNALIVWYLVRRVRSQRR
jgi:uncharacterized membrane protein (DUF2068 family)